MDDLSSSSSPEGGFEQFFQLLDPSDTILIDPYILTNEEPWITNESCHAIQQDDLESAQELACVYPEPLSTFQDIVDSYYQNSAEEC